MPVAAGISAVGSLGGAALGYFGSQNAANAQVQAQQQALQTQQGMFNTVKGSLQPLIDTGMGIAKPAASALTSLLTPGANMTATLSQIPGFQFMQDWGQKAVQNLGTTMGLGGNTLTAGAQYATGAAQQGFGTITSALQGLLNSGLNTATSAGGALAGNATQTGANMGATLGNIGNAQASGILGSTNALSGGLTGGANSVSNALMLSKLFPQLGGGGAGSPGMYGGSPATNPLLNPATYGNVPEGALVG